MTKLGIIGADGRMGAAVARLSVGRFDLVAQVSADTPAFDQLSNCDAVIDFSAPAALLRALPHIKDGTPVISGTTGLSVADEAVVATAATRLPILRSGNFSVGIAVLCALAETAAETLGEGWDIEILETHHRHKVDAPSGTGLMLGRSAAKGRGVNLDDVAAHDRNGARRAGDIGFAVLRGGGVFGEHEVRLISESEQIVLGHAALNRDVFADGALQSVAAMQGRAPGLYSMADVLDL